MLATNALLFANRDRLAGEIQVFAFRTDNFTAAGASVGREAEHQTLVIRGRALVILFSSTVHAYNA